MIKNCVNCGKEFWANRITNRCCSQKCAHKLVNKRIKKECVICGKEYETKRTVADKRKTCSNKCVRIYLSKIHKGKKLWKNRINVIKGEHCWNWKGGITPLQFKIRNSHKYRLWRSDVFTRDNFTCVICNTRGGSLEAHHIKFFSIIIKENNINSLEEALNCEELWNINNGITLCLCCHKSLRGVPSQTQ
jgi:hypothetical protein